MGTVLILDRNADNDTDESEPGGLGELETAMRPLLQAIEAKDLKAMASAFSDAFQIADASPHDEYPHESEEN